MSINNVSDGNGAGHVYINQICNAGASMRSPIFYDSANTAFYGDFVSGSQQQYTQNISGTSGSYGSQLIVGQTSIALPYTLQDTNVRPIIAATGQYPCFHLNHTVTSNANHGPTIQFTYNGLSGRQWLIGGGGTGEDMQIGYSDTSLGNANYNPHNGISGYSGVTYMMCKNNGRIGLGAAGDWGAYGGGYPGYAIDTRGTLYNNTDVRAPIYYDSNNTGYYVDPSSVSNVNQVRTDALSVNTNGSQTTKAGLALYGAATSGEPTYGMMFTGISGSGAFGGVNGDWATYFTMNSTTGRGWIFRDVSSGNVASITNTGWAQFAASVRSPIFYDSNNTAYYGDFASTSQLNVLNCAGTLTVTGTGGVIAPKFTDYNNGAFYLDPSSTGTSLNVAGDVVAYASSDIRFKNNITPITNALDKINKIGNNITPITNALDKINKIGGYTFEWNEKSHKETGKKDIGVIAQEVEEILPEIVDTRDNGYKAVDYSKLTALLIQSVKEQQIIINDLKSRIETLENN
jgi:hypothetical protein